MGQLTLRQYAVDAREVRRRPLDVAFGLLSVAYANMETLAREQSKARPAWCIGCGTCCTNRTPEVYGFESAFVALHLRATVETAKQRDGVLAELEDWLRSPWESVDRGRCAFLSRHNRCTIHPARPFACRAYGLLVPRSPSCRGRRLIEEEAEPVLGGPLVERVTADYYLAVDIVAQNLPGEFTTYWLPAGVWRYLKLMGGQEPETDGKDFDPAKLAYRGGRPTGPEAYRDASGPTR